jgi:hypothetical protein
LPGKLEKLRKVLQTLGASKEWIPWCCNEPRGRGLYRIRALITGRSAPAIPKESRLMQCRGIAPMSGRLAETSAGQHCHQGHRQELQRCGWQGQCWASRQRMRTSMPT